jgi:hypothetical protein
VGGKGFGTDRDNGEQKMKNMRYCVIAFMGFFIAELLGCGYTTRSLINDKYRTIYITPFVNKIDITREMDAGNKYKLYRPMLDTDVTKSLINRFLFDGNLKPVSMESADLVMKGELLEFRKDGLRYDTSDNAQEYRMNLIVNISLWDNRENKLLWEEKNFTGEATYFVSGAQMKTEDAAISDAEKDLCRRIVERVVEQW